MRCSRAVFCIAVAGVCAVFAAPANADGSWHRHRYSYSFSQPRLYKSYPGSIRYYKSACSYGDCECLRSLAVRTGNPVWWDRYQACSGN